MCEKGPVRKREKFWKDFVLKTDSALWSWPCHSLLWLPEVSTDEKCLQIFLQKWMWPQHTKKRINESIKRKIQEGSGTWLALDIHWGWNRKGGKKTTSEREESMQSSWWAWSVTVSIFVWSVLGFCPLSTNLPIHSFTQTPNHPSTYLFLHPLPFHPFIHHKLSSPDHSLIHQPSHPSIH